MEHWLLIIQLSSGAVLPVQDFFSERECLRVLQEWEIAEDAKGGCIPVKASVKKKRRSPDASHPYR